MSKDLSVNVASNVLSQKQQWIAERDAMLAAAKAVTEVESAEQLDAAGAMQTAIGKHIRELDRERKAVTAPLDAVKKEIMAQEKAMRKDLETEQRRIKGLNDAYATKLARERAEAERKRREAEEAARMEAARKQAEAEEMFGDEAVAAGPEPVHEATPVAPPEPPKLGNNRMRKRWDFEVQDANQVPREFLSVDEKKIRAHVAYCEKMDITPEIPGVKLSARMSVEAR